MSVGRPPVPEDEQAKRITITLPPVLAEYVDSFPMNRSATIQMMISEYRRKNMSKLEQITQETENGTEWLINWDFENPETLESYLKEAAPAGTYRIEGRSIWATDEAMDAAMAALEADVASQPY